MPTNLNALIRYKQIDACLKNPFANCTISHLQEICTQSLGENRGIYKQVSERTIRDDIRVLKSDILGFNAPIVFEKGKYSYSNPDYTIFSTPLTEKELLKEILSMLLEERKNITDSEIDRLLLRISNILGEDVPEELLQKPKEVVPKLSNKKIKHSKQSKQLSIEDDLMASNLSYSGSYVEIQKKSTEFYKESLNSIDEPQESYHNMFSELLWGAILGII